MAYNVLIVDDSVIIRTVLERTLRIAGIDVGDVMHAENGIKALEHLEKEWIDIVFADINMPEMNGVELIEAMSKLGYLESIPVVVVTTERNMDRVKELKEKGVRAYMNKPFTPEAIRDTVFSIMNGTGVPEKGGDKQDE